METTQVRDRLRVVRTQTSMKTPMVLGVITAGLLHDTYTVPRRDSRTKEGYQREVSTARVNRLVRDLKERRVDLPTAVLLNLRDYEPSRHLSEEDDGELWFILTDEDRLQVVDGQHRIAALAKLVDDDPDTWSDSPLSRSWRCWGRASARRSSSSTW